MAKDQTKIKEETLEDVKSIEKDQQESEAASARKKPKK